VFCDLKIFFWSQDLDLEAMKDLSFTLRQTFCVHFSLYVLILGILGTISLDVEMVGTFGIISLDALTLGAFEIIKILTTLTNASVSSASSFPPFGENPSFLPFQG